MTKEEALETIDRILNYCEEIDPHLPEEEQTGDCMFKRYYHITKIHIGRNRMKKYYCDKCGMEMTEKEYERPYLSIRKYDIVNGEHYCNDVVLCAECESKFIKWLGEKE